MNIITALSERWEWFDDLVDFIWRGRCEHIAVLVCHDEYHHLVDYTNWLRGLGDWTVELRGVEPWLVHPGDFVLLIHRGWSLLRWSNTIEPDWFERTGAAFDTPATLEA